MQKKCPFNYSEDYECYLEEVENLPSEVISRIDDATRRIISKCGIPNLVQPGKEEEWLLVRFKVVKQLIM